jgi:2-polyprenyl-6-methoxyphenol hydroxylase-like FAD-dependent oxidoreductase
MASDLVEKVARAIDQAQDARFDDWKLEARAAIKAVAGWSMSNYYAETSILRFWTEVLAKLQEPPHESP